MSEHEGKIKLGKVEVKMGDKTVSLTIEQARELSALLKGLFGDDSSKIVHVRDYWYPRPWYFTTYVNAVGNSGYTPSNTVYEGSQWKVRYANNTVSFATDK